jgi:FkbM family methyltransferase
MLKILATCVQFYRDAAPYLKKFGRVAGLRLAWQLRSEYKRGPGDVYGVEVPGIRHPVYLRAATSDYRVFHQILIDEEVAFSLPGSPAFVVDAGANIGLSSVFFANRFPEATILALEIEPSNFAQLRRNTARYTQVTARDVGLWGRRATLVITNPEASHWEFAAAEAPSSSDGGIEAIGVADILSEFGISTIDLLKIDIEGAEVEVFTSAPDRWLNAVRTLAVELHDHFREGCSAALDSMLLGGQHTRVEYGEYTVITREAGNPAFSKRERSGGKMP